MIYFLYLSLLGLLAPHIAYAATFKELVEGQILPFGNTIINLLYALAFVFFLMGLVRYLFVNGGNEEAREQGKKVMVWGIVGLVVLFGLWGFVRLTLSLIGAGGT